MMKKKDLDIFSPPVFTIKSVTPSLERNNTIYARQVKARHKSGKIYEFSERSNIPLEKFIGVAVECIIEIIDATFYYPKDKKEAGELPPYTEKGEYVWFESGDKFIPELVEMVEGHQEEEEYEYDEGEFERLSIDYLKNWGISGLGLTPEQSKPMVRTKEGIYLFNEYQHEDVIDEWKLNQLIYFKPIKMLLRGIKIAEQATQSPQSSSTQYKVKPPNPNVYNTYKGKKYTEAEWKIKEQELWEEYAKKHNLPLGDKDEEKGNDNSPPSRFLLD